MTNRYVHTSLFRTSHSAVFQRVSPFQELRRVFSIAWQTQHLEEINCQVFRMIQIEYNNKCHLHCFWLAFEWEAIRCHCLVCFVCNYISSRVLQQVYPFATQSINLAYHWLFLHCGDISISCRVVIVHDTSAWMKTSRFQAL